MADQNQNFRDANVVPVVSVAAKEFQSKFSSKKECFEFMQIEVQAYLPDYKT